MTRTVDASNDAARGAKGDRIFRAFPLRILTVGVLLSLLAICLGGVRLYITHHEYKKAQGEESRANRLRGDILHLDEVLTMSARMCASTGDLEWETRYREFEPKLDATIKEAIELTPVSVEKEAVAETDEANVRLVEMENQAFELVREGQRADAMSLLFSPEYRKLKGTYANGMQGFVDRLYQRCRTNLAAHERRQRVTAWTTVAAMLTMVLCWVGIMMIVRRHTIQRRRAEKALEEAHARLELRVAERTGELARANDGLQQVIIERERTQEELEIAKNKAETALHDLEQVHAQLLQSEKMASIGQLAAGVAHEINNPIGFISSNLNTLLEYAGEIRKVLEAHEELVLECQKADPKLAAKATRILDLRDDVDLTYITSDLEVLIQESVEGADRVRRIVQDLKDFSHVDGPEVAEDDINELLDKTISVAWNELKYKTEVVREYGDIPAIPCYGGKLGQVFLNLLVNAAHAIEEHGIITIRTGRDGAYIWIEVQDTGSGIPLENLKQIFEPFFTTKQAGKGTGMGLHIAYNIIETHGGYIDCKSTVGEGTTFRVELPVAGPPTKAHRRDAGATGARSASGQARAPEGLPGPTVVPG